MSPVICPGREKLSAYLLGDLAEPELGEVAEHLDCCAECAAEADGLEGLLDTFVSELGRIGPRRGRRAVESTPGERVGSCGEAPGGAPPEHWGDFRIVREIGRGSMGGIVREAYQGSLNRHVALMFLPEHGDLARFRREARAAGRLHQTHIVPVFGVGEHAGRHYYIMQYIAGEGLDAELERRRRTGREPAAPASSGSRYLEAARIGVQVAEALAHAHDLGVIHRDIKPSNLLIDEQGTIWVADFGLAKDAVDGGTLTHTGDLLGTLRYLAPERLSGRCDARADIYGLGATLYELTCGRPAYDQTDRAALLSRLMHHEPPVPRQLDPRVPRDLETIILKAMARDPGDRYQTAAELAGDLRRFVEDRPIRARRAGVWERAARWCRRNPVVTGLLAVVFVLLMAVSAPTGASSGLTGSG
jgi:serine/threonine protein kinase